MRVLLKVTSTVYVVLSDQPVLPLLRARVTSATAPLWHQNSSSVEMAPVTRLMARPLAPEQPKLVWVPCFQSNSSQSALLLTLSPCSYPTAQPMKSSSLEVLTVRSKVTVMPSVGRVLT